MPAKFKLQAQDADIMRWRIEGLSYEEIGRRLRPEKPRGRSYVYQRVQALKKHLGFADVPRPGTIMRACLSCHKPFPSEGSHNRICEPCKGNQVLADYVADLLD